ncbi:MAG: hypothetical protein AB7N76_10025 [Planctomycetota bacterium]
MRPLLPLFLLCAAPALATDPAEFPRRYAETKQSWTRRALVEGLDPQDAKGRALLLGVLAKEPWYQREGAVAALSKLTDEASWAELARTKDPAALEGVARALGASQSPSRLALLERLLGDKAWAVRRAAAIALRGVLEVKSVELLVAAWEREKDFRVAIHCLESLEQLTGERELARVEDWKSWLEAKRDSLDLGRKRTGDQPGGERIRTRARGTNLDLSTRGRGQPLLVLPEYGYEHSYLQTYLRDLEDEHQVLYLRLPGAADFKDPPLQPAPDLPDPYYPIEQLVASLEALHAQLVQEKKIQDRPFAILAHGMTCWIAMRYATLHPKRVRKLLLVAPYSSGAAWEAGRDRVEALGKQTGDEEMVHFAQNQVYGGYEPQGDEDSAALERKELSCYFADPRDLEIGRLWGPVVTKDDGDGKPYEVRAIARPLGTVVIPEFDLAKLPRVRVPTLVVHGDRSVRTSLEDAAVVAQHFGGKVLRLKRAARMGFYEEHDAFVKAARKHLK